MWLLEPARFAKINEYTLISNITFTTVTFPVDDRQVATPLEGIISSARRLMVCALSRDVFDSSSSS